MLGKVIATLDFLSGGRFALGVGIGWLEEEFVALGIPWEHRAKRTREYIEAMRKLWGEDPSSYSGEFVNFKNVRSNPKPVQGAKLPVIFGGESAPALRRVAEYGDGWCGFNLTPDEAAAKIRKIEELLKANGRKRSESRSRCHRTPKQIKQDDLKRYRDAGVDEVVMITLPTGARRGRKAVVKPRSRLRATGSNRQPRSDYRRAARSKGRSAGSGSAMKVGYFAIGIEPVEPKPAMIKENRGRDDRAVGLFESLWAPEHVVLLSGSTRRRYPLLGGRISDAGGDAFGDPFTTLTYAAALTSNIRARDGNLPGART